MASHWRCSRSRRCAHHSARLTVRAASASGMKRQPQDVEGLAEQPRRNAFQQRHHHAIGRDQVPVPVIGQRRIGLMRLQHQIDRRPRRFQRGIVERSLRERRRIAGGDQQHVAFAKGHLEPFCEFQHHVARRRGAAGFHEAQMPRGNLGIAGEIELAEMAALPPFAASDRRHGRVWFARFGPWRSVRSWWKTYHADFTPSITSDVIELRIGADHLRHHRR